MDLCNFWGWFFAVFSAVSGLELSMSKEQHQCKLSSSFDLDRSVEILQAKNIEISVSLDPQNVKLLCF